MLIRLLPDPDAYLAGSGPPGGLLGFQVLALRHGQSPADLLVSRRLVQPGVDLGPPRSVIVADAIRHAWAFVTGESLARTLHLAVRVDLPAGRDALLLLASLGCGSQADPLLVATHPILGAWLGGFRLE